MLTRDDDHLLLQARFKEWQSGVNLFRQVRHYKLVILISSKEDTVNPNIECRVGSISLDSHLIQPLRLRQYRTKSSNWIGIPFNYIIAFLDKMLLEGLHLLSESFGFDKLHCGVLQHMRCSTIQITSRTRKRLHQILGTLADSFHISQFIPLDQLPNRYEIREAGKSWSNRWR